MMFFLNTRVCVFFLLFHAAAVTIIQHCIATVTTRWQKYLILASFFGSNPHRKEKEMEKSYL